MFRNVMIAVFLVCFSTPILAETITKGFEEQNALTEWEIDGNVTISAEQKHSGSNSLLVPAGSSAIFRASMENKFGSVTMWVYDSCVNNKTTTPGKNWTGPYFGVMNSDEQKFVFTPVWRETLKPDTYSMLWTAENKWFNIWPTGVARTTAGWHKFAFLQPDSNTLKVKIDDVESTGVNTKVLAGNLSFFNKGFVGLCLGGRDDLGLSNETFYYDDIVFDLQ